MQIQTEIRFDHINSDLSGSLFKQRHVEIDGARQDVGQPERMAIAPGDIKQAIMFINGEPQPQTEISASSATIQAEIAEPSSASVKPPYTDATEHPIIKALQALWTEDVVAAYKTKVKTSLPMMFNKNISQ